jgi:hypothetical protein
MNNTWIYTPSSNSWEIKPLAATAQGSYPSARSDHSAVVSKSFFIINYMYINGILILFHILSFG